MLDGLVLRTALSAFSPLFGSLGVFFIYLSFRNPALAVHAVLCLASAMAILWSAEAK